MQYELLSNATKFIIVGSKFFYWLGYYTFFVKIIVSFLRTIHLRGGAQRGKTSKLFMGHTVRTESGSIAEVSHLAYFYRSAKYDMSDKNDTIFQLCRRTILFTDISDHLPVFSIHSDNAQVNLLWTRSHFYSRQEPEQHACIC